MTTDICIDNKLIICGYLPDLSYQRAMLFGTVYIISPSPSTIVPARRTSLSQQPACVQKDR